MAVIPINSINLRDDIGQVLLSAGGNVNVLEPITYFSDAAKINENSRRKPVDYTVMFDMTDADYYACDWGYTITTYPNYTEMKNAVKNGATWAYNRPRGGASSPYRLGDFRGYDTEAQVPFKMEADNGSGVTIGGSLRLSLNEDLTDIVKWDKFSGYKGTNIKYLNVGIYIAETGYYFPFTDTNQGLTMNDLDWEKLSISVPTTHFSVNKTYTAYMVLTTWDGANGGRTWYLPSETDYGSWWLMKKGSEVTFKVTGELNPLDYIDVYGYGSGNYSYAGGYYSISGVRLTISVSGSSSLGSTSGTLSINVVIPNNYTGGTSVSSKTIASTSFSNVKSGFNDTKNIDGSNFSLLTSKEDSVSANLELTYVANGKTYTETRGMVIDLMEL